MMQGINQNKKSPWNVSLFHEFAMGFDPVETCMSVTVCIRNVVFGLEEQLRDTVSNLHKLNRIRTVSVMNKWVVENAVFKPSNFPLALGWHSKVSTWEIH